MATTSNGLPNVVTVPAGYKPLNSSGLSLANLAAWHLQLIGQSAILAVAPENMSTQPLGSHANPVMASFKAWKTEPPGSIPFDEQDSYAFTGAASTAFVPVLTMKVPNGFDGVIKWISNNVLPASSFVQGSVLWQILVNGRPVRNFGSIAQEKGTIAQGREISPIRLFSGDVIQYVVQEVTGLGGSTVVSLSGYFYPSKGIS